MLTQSDPSAMTTPPPWSAAASWGNRRRPRHQPLLQDEDGLGLDAIADPVGGFRALYSVGWFVDYEHWWSEKWASNFCYGGTFTGLPDVVPGDTYRSGKYAAANLIWLPIPKLGVGIEYLYGDRHDKDGQSGIAHRLQTAVQYNF